MSRVLVNPQMSADEGANQPTPNCALVVGGVALPPVAAVVTDIGWLITFGTVADVEAITALRIPEAIKTKTGFFGSRGVGFVGSPQ